MIIRIILLSLYAILVSFAAFGSDIKSKALSISLIFTVIYCEVKMMSTNSTIVADIIEGIVLLLILAITLYVLFGGG